MSYKSRVLSISQQLRPKNQRQLNNTKSYADVATHLHQYTSVVHGKARNGGALRHQHYIKGDGCQ